MKKLTKKELENTSLSARIKRRGKTGEGHHFGWVKTTPYGSYETDSRRVQDKEIERRHQDKIGRTTNEPAFTIKYDENGVPHSVYNPHHTKGHRNVKYADGHQRM